MSVNQKVTLSDVLGLSNTRGGYTMEYVMSLIQPHHTGVLYVTDNILYVTSSVQDCVTQLQNLLTIDGKPPQFFLEEKL